MQAAGCGIIAVLSVRGEYPWWLRGPVWTTVLLVASRFSLAYLAGFPLMSRGWERWGKPWAWLYPLAAVATLLLGELLSQWAIKAWLR
jgi:hypothetical protein